MPKATKFYDVCVNGNSVFHGTFSESKRVYTAVRHALVLFPQTRDAVVTISFVPDDPGILCL